MITMDAKPLNSDLLLYYNDYFVEKKASMDILKDFLYNITSMIDSDKNFLPGDMIEEIMTTVDTSNTAYAMRFVKMYADYLGSIAELLHNIRDTSTIEEEKQVNDTLINLYFTYFNLKDSDFSEMIELIRGYAGITISNSLHMLKIDGPVTIKSLTKKLKGKLHPSLIGLLATLMGRLESMFQKPEEVNHENLSGVFSLMVIIVSIVTTYIDIDPFEKLFEEGIIPSFK